MTMLNQMKLLFLLASFQEIVLFLHAAVNRFKDCEHDDKEYYPSTDIKTIQNVATWNDCSELCRGEDKCRFWVWGKMSNRKVSNRGKCWLKLKSSNGKMSNVPGYISGGENCGIVDGEWGAWNISDCSKSCGGGIKTKVRHCNNPTPTLRGFKCELSDNSGIQNATENLLLKCNVEECPITKKELPKRTKSRVAFSSGTGFYITCEGMKTINDVDLKTCSQHGLRNTEYRSFGHSLLDQRCILNKSVKEDITCEKVKSKDMVYFEVA